MTHSLHPQEGPTPTPQSIRKLVLQGWRRALSWGCQLVSGLGQDRADTIPPPISPMPLPVTPTPLLVLGLPLQRGSAGGQGVGPELPQPSV